ncbi:hypothetical protein SAMN03159306_02186 [Pseudomonas sp. NFACC48-1]|nr:hypothetical protein SAMN03159405_06006 [Pseudomonas sp. NFACC44-2]SDA68269.1 hypothetical protein SAMN03159429_02727 [Pseudomonas sp. NFACC51]SDW80268.1 hypothetical protein SAMN03159474_01612 [Pseudomonas sp. NFACC08-1]SEK04155.1 hypothetical protein SAMN03159298_06018 [Pseudomonas sp. NFACC07-1]SFJ47932.1 hypothetical protein SAMN03159302_05926 [Pseudomonas sp. NFACC54]SFS82532.1 hypothetical protein SAMN03159306_02186 [Pseudomonas sp. NFACC48-1]
MARELAPARVRSARKFLGPLRSPTGASSLATEVFSALNLSPPCKTESPQFIFSPSALRNVLGTVQQDTDLQ